MSLEPAAGLLWWIANPLAVWTLLCLPLFGWGVYARLRLIALPVTSGCYFGIAAIQYHADGLSATCVLYLLCAVVALYIWLDDDDTRRRRKRLRRKLGRRLRVGATGRLKVSET